ncbi:hypothetical protein Pmani_026107 [Petrolisthes manimaculis]|uniref:Uncharacterized protein n=1 Tax=Petrolisthes manimaculis TaxID=1843537 RepID=A0AAE1P437_9EUCA|nr:hypothetical protein Pmani_026107 [Petrolisthes manimaculis]
MDWAVSAVDDTYSLSWSRCSSSLWGFESEDKGTTWREERCGHFPQNVWGRGNDTCVASKHQQALPTKV